MVSQRAAMRAQANFVTSKLPLRPKPAFRFMEHELEELTENNRGRYIAVLQILIRW